MATGNTTTSNLADLVAFQYYDRLFLLYQIPRLAWYQFAQKRPLPKNQGTAVVFTRYTRFGRVASKLTEGTNPNANVLSAARISATVEEWGGHIAISSFLDATSIDPEVSEAVSILGIQAATTLDWQVQLSALTHPSVTARYMYPAGQNFSNVTSTQITSILTTDAVTEAVFRLKISESPKFDGGYYGAIVSPYMEYDITQDSDWVTAAEYAGSTQLYEGEIGKWFGVRFVEDTLPLTLAQNNGATASTTLPTVCGSTGALGFCPVFGKESFGVTELTGRKIIIKTGGPQDTSNALDMFRTIGWKQTFVTRHLNEKWIVPIVRAMTLSGVT